MNLKSLLFLVGVGFSYQAAAQNSVVDSLKGSLQAHLQEDSVRVNLLSQLAYKEHFDHPADAANFALEALSISEKINYPKGTVSAYRFLGAAFWAQANFSAALDYCLKGLKVADSIHNPQMQADLTGNIGVIYSSMGNYKTALTYCRSANAQQRQLKNELREAIELNNLGDCFFNLKLYDSALTAYNKAMIIGKSKKFEKATNMRNIGNVYEATGNLELALSYYYKARAASDSTGEHKGMTQARKSIASVFLKKHQYDLAEKELRECLDLAKKANLRAIIRDSYELLSKGAEAQGHLPQYISYFKLFTAYKDSIQNSSATSRIASLQLEYEMQHKQLEIDGLKKNAKTKAEELKWKNALLVSTSIGILLIALFLINVVRNFRHQKSLNVALAERNEEISRQKNELARQHDEVLALNEEIRAQQDEVISQRDILAEKNINIEMLHKKLTEANQNLEKTVTQRTAALQEQNHRLEEYAFINAHKLRAPVASIMGLVNLLELKHLADERSLILDHLKKSSWDLDQVIRSISKTLQQGMTAYDQQNQEHGNSEHSQSS